MSENKRPADEENGANGNHETKKPKSVSSAISLIYAGIILKMLWAFLTSFLHFYASPI